MSYWTLLGGCISAYALLNFVTLPMLKRRWVATRSLSKISKAGVMAGLSTLRNATLIASIMYTAFALVVLFLGILGRTTDDVSALIGHVSSLHGDLIRVKQFAETWLFIVPAVLMLYLAWWRLRQDLRDRFTDRVLDEMDRLNAERAADPAAWTRIQSSEVAALDREIETLTAQTAAIPTSKRDERSRSARALAVLQAKRRAADYEARISLDPIHDALDDRPTTSWGRVRAFFVSRGVLADAKGFTKLVSRATLATLTIAVIGIGTEAGLITVVADRIASLDDLRVENTKEHAPKPLPTESEAANTPTPTSDDLAAVRQITQQFARALVNNRHWRGLQPALALRPETEVRLARRAVLSHAALPDGNGGTSNRAVRAVSDVTVAEQQILDDLSGPASRSESKLGAEIVEQRGRGVVQWFGSRWEQTRKSVLDHAALYRQPVGPDDLQGALLDRVLTAIVNESVPEAGGEIGKQARSAFTAATKSALNESVDLSLRSMLADLDAGVPLDQAAARVRERPVTVAMRHVDQVAAVLHDHWNGLDIDPKIAPNQTRWDPPAPFSGGSSPGSGDGPGAASKSVAGELDNLARTLTENGQREFFEEEFEALNQYEDLFPRTVASQESTPLGQIANRHLLPAQRASYRRMAVTKVARAHSFTMLRGFSRVGGVLIGIDADNPLDTLDLADLDWTSNGRQITLALTTASKVRITAGPYDRATVHQALAYAADGRPVAVTMTQAKPLSQLKIHLHPVLLDTPLGCQVITLDRLVDTYARDQLPPREAMTRQYYGQAELYRLAWASRVIGLAEYLATRSMNDDDKRYVSRVREAATTVVERAERDAALPQALSAFANADGPNSVFRRKPEFFDPALVETTRACANSRSVDRFVDCIKGRSTGRNSEEAARQLRAPASFTPWSGVRERSFHADRNLQFARTVKDDDALLHPFRFMVQLAFTSAAFNVDDPESYVDTNPLEFTDLEGAIHELVRKGVVEHQQAAMLSDLRNFTLLQRLFRVLLNGQGGPGFPVRKLAQLEAATAGSVTYVHTRRWNGSRTRQFDREVAAFAASRPNPSDPEWVRSARTSAARCLPALKPAAEGRLTEDEWARTCSFSDSVMESSENACSAEGNASSATNNDWFCRVAGVARAASVMPTLRNYERTFGVLQDEALEAKSSCSALPQLAGIN